MKHFITAKQRVSSPDYDAVQIESYHHSATQRGPPVLVLVRVHADEPSEPVVMEVNFLRRRGVVQGEDDRAHEEDKASEQFR